MDHKLEKQVEELCAYIKTNVLSQKTHLTLQEAAEFLGISKSYLYKLTSQRRISFYRPATKLIYFKRIELENWILKNKSLPIEEEERTILSLKNLKK